MSKTEKHEKQDKSEKEENNICFVIMPISEPEGYSEGHFRKVYEDIFIPACKDAGFEALRADEVKQTNLIHLDILQKLIESPMAICDLSSRNPNVLFELGMRQAFDKPTVLVQESGTEKIFDIAMLRYTEYRKELRYREVLEDQIAISLAIKSTKEATDQGKGVNSIVKILSLSKPASIDEVKDSNNTGLLQLVRAEMSEIRSDFRKFISSIDSNRESTVSSDPQLESMLRVAQSTVEEVERMIDSKAFPAEFILDVIQKIRLRLTSNSDDLKSSTFQIKAQRILADLNRMERQINLARQLTKES